MLLVLDVVGALINELMLITLVLVCAGLVDRVVELEVVDCRLVLEVEIGVAAAGVMLIDALLVVGIVDALAPELESALQLVLLVS